MARQPVTFLVLARKVTQRSRPRCAALRVPCVARTAGPPHKLARPAARSRAQTYSSDIPRLSCATRRRTGEGTSKAVWCALRAHFVFLVLGFGSSVPCAPPRKAVNKRGFRRALFELRGGARGVCPARASCAAPLVCRLSREPPKGAANQGRLLFGYFFFGEARKSD